jgi:lysophospholipase L1-like esterase
MDEFLGSKSQLFSLVKQQIFLEGQKYGRHFSYLPHSFLVKEKNSTRWQVAATLCQMTKEVFDRYDTPVFFVLLPPLYQVQEAKFYEYLDFMKIPYDSVDLWQPNKIISDLFSRYNLRLVDVCPYMTEKAKHGIKMYGTRDRHFNEEGNRAVAEAVFPVVEEYLAAKLKPKKVPVEMRK